MEEEKIHCIFCESSFNLNKGYNIGYCAKHSTSGYAYALQKMEFWNKYNGIKYISDFV